MNREQLREAMLAIKRPTDGTALGLLVDSESIDAIMEKVAKHVKWVIGEDELTERLHVSHFEHTVACIPGLEKWARDDLRMEQRKKGGV